MADLEQKIQESTPKQKRRILKHLLWTIVLLFITLTVVLGCLISSDRGSQFLLDRVLERQKIIQYEYESGNLLSGIILKKFLLDLESVDVTIDKAEVSLGWRAIVKKEIHLTHAKVENLRVILKGQPNNKPFSYPEIKLPFVLRVDNAAVDHLKIVTKGKTEVDFYHIFLNDTLWVDTKLEFADTAMDMGYLNTRNAKGYIDFHGKYPLKLQADLNLPSLRNIGIHDIAVNGSGSLHTIEVGVGANTPNLLSGWMVLQPMNDGVPMFGRLNFKDYTLPFLTEQKIFLKSGYASFEGNHDGFNIDLNTDLRGEYVPEGHYNAQMYTDFVTGLDVKSLSGQVMDGIVNVAGRLDWDSEVVWDMVGHIDQINPKHKSIPLIIQDFLPLKLDAVLASTGTFKDGLHLTAAVDFGQGESWKVKLDQNKAKKENDIVPLMLDVKWNNINRAMPYIGWLKSDSGNAKLALTENQQDIFVATQITQYQDTFLPTGMYKVKLKLKNDDLNIPEFSYQNADGEVRGQGKLALPTQKRQLQWTANLHTKNFNPQLLLKQAPVNLINGKLNASGYAKPNRQIIQLTGIDLTGRLANKAETVRLTGKTTAVLDFWDEKKGGGFKAFAVDYEGELNASQLPTSTGILKAKVAGTPKFIKIDQLQYKGIAGQIRANGALKLNQGFVWDVNASLIRFKPQYFVNVLQGELSGNIKTQGIWADDNKRINIQKLNLAGKINNTLIRGAGDLNLFFDKRSQGFLPLEFKANNLFLVYGSNQLRATGTGKNLQLKINAPKLNELNFGLEGGVEAELSVQAKPHLKAIADIKVDKLKLNGFNVAKLSIKGELPISETIPTRIVARLEGLDGLNQHINRLELSLAGTKKAHILKIGSPIFKSKNSQSKGWIDTFYIQLAGGFNAQNDWLGQIQKGKYELFRTSLVQLENANVVYKIKTADLYIGAHCWGHHQSKICLDQPLRIGQKGGSGSFSTRNLDLNDFSAFMPRGVVITGNVNGYAKAEWFKGQRPKVDARLLASNGLFAMRDMQDDQVESNLRYKQIALVANSVSNGLKLRLDLLTERAGQGYVKVVIDPDQNYKLKDGEIAFDRVNLSAFSPFIADIRKLDGVLSYAGKISGTLRNPKMEEGVLRLTNGTISMISLPIHLTNIQLYSQITHNNVAIVNGSFNAGQGNAKLTGKMNWGNTPLIDLTLTGKDLEIKQVPLVSAKLSIKDQIRIRIEPSKQYLSINNGHNNAAEIEIPWARITMPESTAKVINTSPDVHVVYAGQNKIAMTKPSARWKIDANLNVILGKDVIFQAFNSQIPLGGRLYLKQHGLETAMRAEGAIGVLVRERPIMIDAYGQSLQLRRAIARFNGALSNPSLEVEATKMVGGGRIGVRITGTASNPAIKIFNEAGLSEQEALNALITGRINDGSNNLSQAEGFKSDVNNLIAAAGISMGLGGTRALTNQIGQTFGLSGLALDAQGTGDDTQVSLTGYITPDLFIRYGVGVFTPVNKLTLRYQMNRRLYLEASQSLERAIDLFYNWRY